MIPYAKVKETERVVPSVPRTTIFKLVLLVNSKDIVLLVDRVGAVAFT